MKLFKSLLIAPAAFGLMAPIAVNADTAFSPTSKLGSSVNFTIGSNTDSADGDELHSTLVSDLLKIARHLAINSFKPNGFIK